MAMEFGKKPGVRDLPEVRERIPGGIGRVLGVLPDVRRGGS